MLDDQHFPPHLLGVLPINVYYISKSPAGPGSKNKYDAGNSEVEELLFKIEDNIT